MRAAIDDLDKQAAESYVSAHVDDYDDLAQLKRDATECGWFTSR